MKRKVARKKRRTDTLLMVAAVVLKTKVREDFIVTEKARLIAATSASAFKSLLRHYAKQAFSVVVKSSQTFF